MKPSRYISHFLLPFLFFFTAICLSSPVLSNIEADHGLYAELLSRYVKKGVVDYQGFKDEEDKLVQYLQVLERTDTEKLSRNDRFAFYINAYNAWTIKLILGAYPGVKSIKDLGTLFRSPWKKQIARIDNEIISLDYIEHQILRPEFKDPRVHFAINCASKSCPPLRAEPYEGKSLNRQLDQMAEDFINDPARNRLEGSVLYASNIFNWFAEDFNGDITGFFMRYAKGDLRTRLKARRHEIKIKYLDYDWSLNGR